MHTIVRKDSLSILKEGASPNSLNEDDYWFGVQYADIVSYTHHADLFHRLMLLRCGPTALTPYMMKFIDVIPILLKNLPFHSLMRISTEGAEHLHYIHMCFYYQHSSRGGGWKKNDTILMLLEWTYRQLRHRISLCPPQIREDFEIFVQKCIDEAPEEVKEMSSAMSHQYIEPEMDATSDDLPPLHGQTFVIAGTLGRGYTAAKVKDMITECGGRVVNKLPHENLPVKYKLISSQQELDKDPSKICSNISSAFRRNWDILSVNYVLEAQKTGKTPQIEPCKLKLLNLKQASCSSILSAATTRSLAAFTKSRSGLCSLKRKRRKDLTVVDASKERRKHRKKARIARHSGWSVYLKEKFGHYEGTFQERTKVIAAAWKDMSQTDKAR